MKKISKKAIIYFLGLTILITGYLLLANYLIYYRIHQGNLVLPDTKHDYMIGSSSSTGLVYVALGDSLTSGVGVEKYEDSYPYLVASELSKAKNAQIELKTFSYPGARTTDLIRDLLDPAIASNPDMITLMIGVNDIHGRVGKEEFRDNYEYILGRLTKETRARIYVVSIPNIGTDESMLPPYKYYFEMQTQFYNQIVRSLAEKYGLYFIDLTEATMAESGKNDGYYSRDLFHPSAKGYRIWAQIIYDNINR